jgi:hypothetical protein
MKETMSLFRCMLTIMNYVIALAGHAGAGKLTSIKYFIAVFDDAVSLRYRIVKWHLTYSYHWHKIAPNMLKSLRWFAFYFYYGLLNTVAVGGA